MSYIYAYIGNLRKVFNKSFIFQTRFPQIHDPEHLRPAIEEFLEKIQFTDACFLYSPPQVYICSILI